MRVDERADLNIHFNLILPTVLGKTLQNAISFGGKDGAREIDLSRDDEKAKLAKFRTVLKSVVDATLKQGQIQFSLIMQPFRNEFS